MAALRYPSLYQINTRVWLTELSRTLGRDATLDDVPDAALDRLAEQGFDWVWFLSVWQTGPAAQAISRANPEWRARVRGNPARPHRRRYRRLRLRDPELHGPSRSGRRRGARTSATAAARTRIEVDARLRPQPHGPGSPRGSTSTRNTSSMAARPIWLARRATTSECPQQTGRCCSRTAGTRTLTAGPTRCSSIMATRTCSRR